MVTARAGDFAGLVNVKELTINAKDIDPGAFIGLDSLTKMTLTMPAQGTISQEAFNGLPNLTEINIDGPPFSEDRNIINSRNAIPRNSGNRYAIPWKSPARGIAKPAGAGNTRNKVAFRQRRGPGSKHPRQNGATTIPGATVPDIRQRLQRPRRNLPPIGPNTLTPFPNLKYLNIYGSGDNRITLNAGSFTNNPNLTEIAISGRITNARNAFKSLHKLEELRISTPDGAEEIELALSPNSPLMKDILNRDKEPPRIQGDTPGSRLTYDPLRSQAEACAHGIAPVHQGHPAYQYIRDADGEGMV